MVNEPNGDTTGSDVEWTPVTFPEGVTRQGLAAFCLWEQEFGFTREDVEMHRYEADMHREALLAGTESADAEVKKELHSRLHDWHVSMADRLESLLPTEEDPEEGK